jgi:acetyl-CoA synthase
MTRPAASACRNNWSSRAFRSAGAPAGAFWQELHHGGVRHRLCLPGGHGLRRHQARRLPGQPDLQQGSDLRLRHGFGEVSDEWYANAAGAINWGFPTISDYDIPQVLPTGICTYEHVVSRVPHEEIVQKAIEVRGLKVSVTKIDIPMSFGPAFEGERIRKDDLFMECGGGRTPGVEVLISKEMEEIEDGKVIVEGPDIQDIEQGHNLPLAILVEVAGREMQSDYEPILERQFHHLINYIQGLMHMGQRDIMWLRIGKAAVEKGFSLVHIGKVLHGKLHQEFGAIVDKIQVKIYTTPERVEEVMELAKQVYASRDERLGSMTDETEEVFYSCTLCQSFAPSHVCIITPERIGMCGPTTGWTARLPTRSTPPAPTSPSARATASTPPWGFSRGSTSSSARPPGGRSPSWPAIP